MDEPPCNCSNRVSIEYLSEGRYRLGDKTLFIRVSAANTRALSCFGTCVKNSLLRKFLSFPAWRCEIVEFDLIYIAKKRRARPSNEQQRQEKLPVNRKKP